MNLNCFRLCGSYGAMDGGNLCDALVDFTSGLSERVDLKDGYKTDEDKKNLLRKQMLRKHDEHALMCCAIAVIFKIHFRITYNTLYCKYQTKFSYFQATDSSQFEARTKTGLIMGHAYGITAVRDINLGSAGLLSLFKYSLILFHLRQNKYPANEKILFNAGPEKK